MLEILPLRPDDAGWKRSALIRAWGGTTVARLGRLVDVMPLDGFIAHHDGERRGLLTFNVAGDELEVVTIHTDVPGKGIGRGLMDAARRLALAQGLGRIWLTTTNDNVRAIEFYQRLGMDLVRLHHDGVARSRRLKPAIPLIGDNGIPIRHELEFELVPDDQLGGGRSSETT